jgi:hypothetical protein
VEIREALWQGKRTDRRFAELATDVLDEFVGDLLRLCHIFDMGQILLIQLKTLLAGRLVEIERNSGHITVGQALILGMGRLVLDSNGMLVLLSDLSGGSFLFLRRWFLGRIEVLAQRVLVPLGSDGLRPPIGVHDLVGCELVNMTIDLVKL